MAQATLARFTDNYIVNDETGCWEWQGRLDRWGYGHFSFKGSNLAHRFSYWVFKHPIPDGLTIDHLCRVKHCVNPDHMEAVTTRENTLRSDGPSARFARRTHCQNGHEFTPENTRYETPTHRKCRACQRRYDAKRRAVAA